MNFKDLLLDEKKMPDNLEEVYISHLCDTMNEMEKGGSKEDLSFVNGFLTEYGHEIYEFNLKTFTKEEVWQNILLSKTEEYKKMMKFVLKFNEFLFSLFVKYSDEQEKKEEDKIEYSLEYKRSLERIKNWEDNKDEWTTDEK